MVGQALVEALLGDPGEFAQVVEPDHAGTALERVEGPAEQLQRFDVPGRLAPAGQGIAGGLQNLACFLQEDVAHLRVDADRRRRRRRGAFRQGVGERGDLGHEACRPLPEVEIEVEIERRQRLRLRSGRGRSGRGRCGRGGLRRRPHVLQGRQGLAGRGTRRLAFRQRCQHTA